MRLELSQAMRRFGSKVSLIDRNDPLHREDDDITKLFNNFLKTRASIVLNARIKTVSGKSGQSVKIVIERDRKQIQLEGSHLLVATGRAPNTGGIGLELTGVETTATGYIKVNERLETTAPGVWAIGEVAGSPQFTHVSLDDFG